MKLYQRSIWLSCLGRVINTELTRHTDDLWYGKMLKSVYMPHKKKTPLQGAQNILYCCLEPKLESKGFFSFHPAHIQQYTM